MTASGWPVVRWFEQDRLARIRMPVGGIGTGCVSLGGRGQLVDWELFNRPSKGLQATSFLAVRVSGPTGTHTRALEARLDETELDGPHGSPSTLHGLPRFRHGRFGAAYPLATVELSDPDLPITATLEAFNPLVPGDAEASGIPGAVIRVRLRNTSSDNVDVAVCGSLENIVGATQRPDRSWHVPDGNRYDVVEDGGLTTLLGSGAGTDRSESDGTMALSMLGRAASHRTAWAKRSWGDSLLEMWDDLSDDGRLEEPDEPSRVPTGSLVSTAGLGPGQESVTTFLVTWHFPNRYGWPHSPARPGAAPRNDVWVGNHYAARWSDAAEVARDLAGRLEDLQGRTVDFVSSVSGSGLPPPLQDAALSTLAVLKSPTCFRIEDGTFLAWEGTNDDTGSCHGSCTHVWNYQYALEALFPELAWTMRSVEFGFATDERGLMSFRAGLPLAEAGTEWPIAAADGQFGTVVRLWRTHRAAPDDALLRRLWPKVRSAVEFAWIEKGWDADQDGLMEGCQHNTMDVEYYGPSGVNQSWYLAGLAAAAELARAAGDAEFASRCEEVRASGAKRTDEVVFNGDYYQQVVIPAGSEAAIADGLRIRYEGDTPAAGSDDLEDPDLQIGSGCTADQLVGHTMAELAGLATGLDAGHVSQALDSVLRHNRREDLTGHFNHMRSYAVGEEAGLLVCSFPRGDRPRRPFPYCNEVWTGLEYTAAIGLLLDGRVDDATTVVRDVRDRYDGRRRNPFDEVECGHHYARSMAAWGLVEAWHERQIRETPTMGATP